MGSTDSGRIRVNTDSLNSARQSNQQRMSQIRKLISEAEQLETRLGGMWTGSAHDAFHTSFRTDLEMLNTLCDRVQEVITYEETAVNEYTKCETKVAELVSGIRI